MLNKQTYRMSSRRVSTRLQETVHSMGSKVQNVQRAGDAGAATQCEEKVLKKRPRLEREERYLVRDGV